MKTPKSLGRLARQKGLERNPFTDSALTQWKITQLLYNQKYDFYAGLTAHMEWHEGYDEATKLHTFKEYK